MSKKHDENQDIRILSRRFKINDANKTIQAFKGQIIGNKTWGRLDYLCHYCGYVLVWNSGEIINEVSYVDNNKKQELRTAKKENKQYNMNNKNHKRFAKQ